MKCIKLLVVDLENNIRFELVGHEDDVDNYYHSNVVDMMNEGDYVYRFKVGDGLVLQSDPALNMSTLRSMQVCLSANHN